MTSESTKKPSKIVEVCSGPDCSAGGAAILELEELVSEHYYWGAQTHFDGPTCDSEWMINRGGCRNLCSMGPNVHVASTHHCTKVGSSEDCLQIARTRMGLSLDFDDSSRIESTSSRIVAVMKWKQSQRQRWKVLREISRHSAPAVPSASSAPPPTASSTLQRWKEELAEAYETECMAAGRMNMASERLERAARRYQRLLERVSDLES